jgi:hypothetical protein
MTSKSKTLACWIAILAGFLGAHRFYLRGAKDPWAWVLIAASSIGLYGVRRMNTLGQDDQLAWILIPSLGLSVCAAMMSALVYGLSSEQRWSDIYQGKDASDPSSACTSWLTILGVIAALMIGSTVLMASIAFTAQRFFEYQALQTPHDTAGPAKGP